jgi:hypothetical protein
MLEFLTAAALVVLLVVGVLVTIAGLALRRIRRSRPVATATQCVVDAALALNACRPRPTLNRAAALPALRISRGHRLLWQRVAAAQRAGAYLGEVPSVLPRLEADGHRIRAGLGQLVGSTATGHDLLAQADRHLAMLADLTDAVGTATLAPAVDESLAREAEQAALGLRLHNAAYTELMAMGTARGGDRGQLGPRAHVA